MGIYLRAREARVAQEFLNRAKVRARVKHMRGEAVAQRVRADLARRGGAAEKQTPQPPETGYGS